MKKIYFLLWCHVLRGTAELCDFPVDYKSVPASYDGEGQRPYCQHRQLCWACGRQWRCWLLREQICCRWWVNLDMFDRNERRDRSLTLFQVSWSRCTWNWRPCTRTLTAPRSVRTLSTLECLTAYRRGNSLLLSRALCRTCRNVTLLWFAAGFPLYCRY